MERSLVDFLEKRWDFFQHYHKRSRLWVRYFDSVNEIRVWLNWQKTSVKRVEIGISRDGFSCEWAELPRLANAPQKRLEGFFQGIWSPKE